MLKSTNLLIYIYLILCACMLAFDLFTVVLRKHSLNVDTTQQTKWKRYLNFVCYTDSRDRMSASFSRNALVGIVPRYLRFLLHGRGEEEILLLLLGRLGNLTAFQAALTLYQENPANQAPLSEWIQQRKTVFVRLCDRYMSRNSAIRAFYAFLCRQCMLGDGSLEDPITGAMLLQVTDPSLYCRENALKALYAFGGVTPVVQALIRLSAAGVEHSSKLVTEGLLSFTGNRQELSDALWKAWNDLLPFYRTAVVNYMRMADPRFCRRLLPVLRDEAQDRELRLAIVRYYRRYRYEPARGLLQYYVLSSPTEGWEFAALSASSLESYPGADTEDVLLQALRHRNWYVRGNAAEALLALRAAPLPEAEAERVLALLEAATPALAAVAAGGGEERDGDAAPDSGTWYARALPNGTVSAIPVDDPVVSGVLGGGDRYARDILRYKLEAFRQVG